MKKQFLVAALITFLGLCFCSINDNSLKACGTYVTTCSSIKKVKPVIDKSIKEKIDNYIPSGYAEETDAPYDMFMNPFTHL